MKLRIVVKHIVYTLLALAAGLRRRRNQRPDRSQLKEILVVHLGLLGDVLLITPLLEVMRETLPPGARITLVVPPVSLAVVRNNPHVDVVATYDAFWAHPADNHRHALKPRHLLESYRFIRAHRRREYDLILNCWVMDQPLASLLLSFLKTRCLLGFDFKYSRRFCDVTLGFNRDRHISDNVIDLFGSVLNVKIPALPRRLHYRIPDEEISREFEVFYDQIRKPFVLISPFSSESAKEWALTHWSSVLGAVARAYPQVPLVVTGLPKSRARSEILTRAVRGNVLNAVGQLTFPQFAFVAKNAAAIITTESGTMHLASAFNVPVFVLFSQIYNYRQFLPYHVYCEYSVVPVACAECIYGCPEVTCMKHDVAQVIDQLNHFFHNIPELSGFSLHEPAGKTHRPPQT